MENLYEEVTNLTEVWQELQKVWGVIEPLVDTPLSALVQRKVKSNFDEAESKLQGLPAKFR